MCREGKKRSKEKKDVVEFWVSNIDYIVCHVFLKRFAFKFMSQNFQFRTILGLVNDPINQYVHSY